MRIFAENGYLEFNPIESAFLYTHDNSKIEIPRDNVDINYRPGLYVQDNLFIESVLLNRLPHMPACLLEDAFETNKLIDLIQSSK